MTSPHRLCLITPLVISLFFGIHAARSVAEESGNSAIVPVPREGNWTKRHEAINQRAKQGDVDLLFIGDSITQGWDDNEVWKKFYSKRKAMNAGISGDRTQHVLWRLDHGNIDGIKPKLAVLMIGTNNTKGDNTGTQIGEGIGAIVKKLREKLPETKVLILGIFPRGEKPNPQRDKNAEASQIAAKLADGDKVQYLDIGEKFLDKEGNLSEDIMPDYLHLTLKGYQIWAESIEAKVTEMLGEKKE